MEERRKRWYIYIYIFARRKGTDEVHEDVDVVVGDLEGRRSLREEEKASEPTASVPVC